MLTVEATSVVGRLTLRRMIEESYQYLRPFVTDGFRVKQTLLDPDGSFQVQVNVRPDKQCPGSGGVSEFTISLPLAEVADLDNADFLPYLTLQFVKYLPDAVRGRCADTLDAWAGQLGKLTKAELLQRPEVPVVPTSEGGAA